jgi:hypothetical protein
MWRRIFFEKHISEMKTEINGIPEYVANLNTSDFVKHNAANHTLTRGIRGIKQILQIFKEI